MARIHEGLASDGLVCLARNQWAGKGQRGRAWFSEPGQNLIMSLIIEPVPLILIPTIPVFCRCLAGGPRFDSRLSKRITGHIKWPNDIYWNDRKAAGILIESVIQGKNWPFAVVGIGINLNQESFPEEIPNAISLKQITGSHYDPVAVCQEAGACHSKSGLPNSGRNPEQILQEFNQFLYKRNRIGSNAEKEMRIDID